MSHHHRSTTIITGANPTCAHNLRAMAPVEKRQRLSTARLRAVNLVGPSLSHTKKRHQLAIQIHLRTYVSLGRRRFTKQDAALCVVGHAIELDPEPAAQQQPTPEQAQPIAQKLEEQGVPGTSGRDAEGQRLLRAAQAGDTLTAKHMFRFTPASQLPELINYQDPVTGITPLAAACEAGHADLVKQLLKLGADCYSYNSDGVSPLMRACQNGHSDVVSMLLTTGGADAHAMTYSDGRTALMDASAAGSVPCIHALLRLGQVDVRQGSEQTGAHPLLEAALYGRFTAAKALLAAGARVNQTDKAGHTALLVAARQGDARMVTMLLAAGAKQFAEFTLKRTPLMEAACEGYLEVCKLLLAAGADLKAQDMYGNTAAKLAGRPAVRSALLNSGR